MACRMGKRIVWTFCRSRFLYVFTFAGVSAVSWCQCRANPVTVQPGDNLQALVSACPPGTTFSLVSGVHHDSVTSPKSNDVFTGSEGAVENGAKVLTGWKQVLLSSGSYWTAPGGAPLPSDPSMAAHCQPNYPACWYSQDLFVDNAPYVRGASLADLAPGAWYYDLSGDDGGTRNNVYLAADPTGHVVELSAQTFAFFSNSASGITIQNLTIEKYGPGLQEGAVEPRAPGWTIQQCEIRFNRGAGISIRPNGSNTKVRNNSLHDNGQFGINAGAVSSVVVDGNEIYHNNIDHVKSGFGSGCCKFTGKDFTISNNKVHDNLGMGLWSDVFASGITYSNNVVYGNTGEGIRVEVSDRNTIINNTVYDNGFGNPDEGNQKGPQIHYASSSHGVITGNIVTASANSRGGIIIDYNAKREGCGQGCKVPQGMNVCCNRILVVSADVPAVQAADYSNTFDQWGTDGMFEQNTYCLPHEGWKGSIWRLGNGNPPPPIDFKTWQRKRQDAHGMSVGKGECSSAQMIRPNIQQ